MSLLFSFAFILLQIPSLSVIENKVTLFSESVGISSGIVSMAIKDCESGDYLLNFNGNKLVNSASTLKLITTATAIEVLGGSHTFSSELGYFGEIVGEKLQGGLVISGTGDPAFGSVRFGVGSITQMTSWVNKIKEIGIKEINGDIVLLNSEFENFDVADTWAWYDLGNYYGATPYLLNFNENKFSAYFDAGSALGEAAQLKEIEPRSPSWRVINQVTTAKEGSGDKVYMYSSPLSNTILMRGTIPLRSKNFEVKGAIPNPPLLIAELLRREFAQQGITYVGDIRFQRTKLMDNVKSVIVTQSPPLQELAQFCNFYSINLVADALLKQLGYAQTGDFTYESGIETLTDFWQKKGVHTQELAIKDGSGLSPSGTLTTSVMCDILNQMQQSPNFDSFLTTIPRLGMQGTVANIGNRANGNVYVKSGSIEATRAYAGYVRVPDGRWLSFMICVNRFNPEASGKVNRFLREILLDLSALN